MNSERTQIARVKVSAPTRWILGHVDLSHKQVLHHGEGKAILDTVAMNDAGAYAVGFDPNTINDDYGVFDRQWDIAISNYVFNTLLPGARYDAWQELLGCVDRVLVTVRTDYVSGETVLGTDGVRTKRDTFQTQLTTEQWVQWFEFASPEKTSVKVLHRGSGFAIIDVWR